MQYSGLLYYINPGAAVKGSGTVALTIPTGTATPGVTPGSVTLGTPSGTVTPG